jgi:gamma-aminobutyric acid receptor subunit alpha
MQIELKRHTGFYVLQIYIPSIMLVILSWVSFFLNREATSDRSCTHTDSCFFPKVNQKFLIFVLFVQGIGIMCILSLATLSLDIRKDIPNVYYGTALDWFIIMCYCFLFASMTQFTVVHYFTKVMRIWHDFLIV